MQPKVAKTHVSSFSELRKSLMEHLVWKSHYEHLVWECLYEDFVWKFLYEDFVWKSLYDRSVTQRDRGVFPSWGMW